MKLLTMISVFLMTSSSHASEPLSTNLSTVEYVAGYVVSATHDGYEISPQIKSYKVGVEVATMDGVCERTEYKLIELKKVQLEYGEMSLPTISVDKTIGPCAV